MDAYIVIGAQHSYKSSVLRSLSGSRISGVRPYVIFPRTVQDVYVRLSSLQEGKGIQPSDFVAFVSTTSATAALFALRSNGIGAFPDADSYAGYFVGAGWTIRRVAVLNSATNPFSMVLTPGCVNSFPLGPAPIAVNEVANDVRTHFNWR